MVVITFANREMVLTVQGTHKLWALKSELRVPLAQVAGARIDPETARRPKGWRVGTHMPGVITAGTFRRHGQKVFWDVSRKKNAIVIDLQGHAYKQLVVEVADPPAAVAAINRRSAG